MAPSFIVAEYWGQRVMNRLGVYPLQCELDAITAAAVQACDGLDGLSEGIIAAPEECHFNTHTLVGESFNCSGVHEDLLLTRCYDCSGSLERSSDNKRLELHILSFRTLKKWALRSKE
jgi:hypothetical protein